MKTPTYDTKPNDLKDGGRFKWLRVDRCPALQARVSATSTLIVREVRYDGVNFGATDPAPNEDAFSLGLILRDHPSFELRSGGKVHQASPSLRGDTFFFDMKDLHSSATRHPFHWLMIVLPQTFLDEIAHDFGAPRVSRIGHQVGSPVRDRALSRFAERLTVYLAAPNEWNALEADHLMLSLAIYTSAVHGDLAASRKKVGGLTRWQESVAKELIDAHLASGVALETIATACGLGISQFAHAFKTSVGCAPYEWLQLRRIDRARTLLNGRQNSLSEIAYVCGFADQSHFTRTFRRRMGITPGAWRTML